MRRSSVHKRNRLYENTTSPGEIPIKEVVRDNNIKFTFPNLKNLSESDITYSEFLACVAQRLLLKQYSAQTMDLDNFLCPMSRTTETFNRIKKEYNVGIDSLFLKKGTIKTINSQSSDNRITEEEQERAAIEFVKWYEKYWFEKLKSTEMLESLEFIFKDSVPSEIETQSGDWETLSSMFYSSNPNAFFQMIDAGKEIFMNKPEEMPAKWFNDILDSVNRFIDLTGNNSLDDFDVMCKDGKLIAPTVSSFVLSTLYGIGEIEERRKKYTAPLEPYNMFYILRDGLMSPMLKMNQLVFTTYNYFKILV